MPAKKDAERQEAVEKLRQWIKPGDTVYTVLRHVSRSGMQREIGVVLISNERDGRAVDLHPNYLVSKALGDRQGKQDGIIVGGCGMDMGFSLIHNLSYALYPVYSCVGEHCPSADHSNPGECRKNTEHKDGYALRQRWI